MAFERKTYQEYRRQNTGSVNNGGTQTNTQPDSTVKFKRKSYHEYLNSESKTDLAGFDSYQQWLNHAHQAISDYNKLAEKAKDYDSGKKFSAYQAQNAARFGNLRNEWNQQRDAIDNLIATGGLSSEQGQAYKKQAKEIAGILSNMAKDTSAADYWKQWESEADYAATQEQQRIAGLDMESLNRKLEELDRTISKLRRNGAGYDYQANPQAYETYWRQVGELEQIRTQTKKDREALGTYQQQQKSAEAAQKEAERIAGLDMESLQRIREIYTENRNRIEQEKLQYDTISQQEQIDGLIRKQELNQQQLDEVNRDIYARERYEKGLEYQRIYETRKEDAYLPGLKDRTYQLVNGTWTNLKENLYSGMEEAERQIYNTIVAQQGLTKGEEYLEWLKPELNRRYAAQMHERLADTANAHPIAGTMMNMGAGLWKPLGYGYTAVQNIANRVNNEYQPIDPNAGWFAPNIASEATTEGLTRDMSDAGKFLTQTGLSIAQNLFFMGFGEATSLALMGLGSASDTSREILQRGGSNEQAAWGGAAAGAAEVLFEKVSLDSLIRLKDTDNLRDAVGNILKQAGVEASEEAFTELTNNLSDQLINGGLSNYQQAVQRYMAQGMEEAEAKKAASAEVAGEIGLAALGGALSGGVLAGGKTVMQYNGGQQNILQERERENRALQEDARARYEAAKKQVEAAQASAQAQDTAAAQQSKTGEAAGRTEVAYRADGARTEATGIDRIEANGKTYVKTADGNTTALEELSFAEERMGMLYENAELFGTEGGRAYVSGYDGRDIGIYTNSWAGVYNRAANGSSEAAAVKYGKEAGLSEAQALSAYYSGHNSYAAGESKNAKKYAIKYDAKNTPYVDIEEDILQNVPRKEWVKTVKNTLREKFPDGIEVGNNTIKINKKTVREMTFSKYMQWALRNDTEAYADKLRATNNTDEILRASGDYVNEALLHPRKDNIQEFARGRVLLSVGQNSYEASVIVGKTFDGELLLYDIINLKKTSIMKKADAHTEDRDNAQTQQKGASANNRITQGENTVNPNIRQKGKKDTALRKEKFAGETKRLVHHYSGTLTAEQQDTLRILDIAAQVLDRTVYIEDSIDGEIAGQRAERGANAYFDPRDNSYHLALDATQQGYLTIMLHEAVHDIAANNRAGYEQLAEVVMKYLQEEKAQEQVREDILRYEQRGYREAEEIEEELVANAVGVILNDRRTAEEFAKRFLARDTKARKAFMRILDNLREYLKRTIAAIKGEADFRQTELLEKRAGAIEEIRQAMFDAMEGLRSGFSSAQVTGIKLSEKNTYPYDMQKVIEEYLGSINHEILEYVNAVKEDSNTDYRRIKVCDVNEKQATDLKRLTGKDFSGYQNAIDKSAISHIEKRHGMDGIADSSMRNAEDIARIGYILQNYDSAELTIELDGNEKYSKGFMDKNNKPVQMLRFSKKINGTYYAVIACPEARWKKLWVVTAYIGNKKSSQVTQALDAETPSTTSETPLASPMATDNSITQNENAVNPSIRENAGNDAKEYSEKGSAGKKKYSLKSTEAAVVIQPNDEQQAEQLEKLRSTLDRQYRLKVGRQMTREAAEKLAGRAIRRFHSGYAAEKLAADLQTIFDEAGGNFDADIFLAEGARAMKGVLAESSTFDKAAYAQYAPVRELLKQKMTLTETQKEEAAATFGSYGEYRRQLFGSTSLGSGGTSLDIAWQELHRLAPELFPAESSEGDMVSALYDAVQAVKKENFYVNEFAMNLDEAATVAFADLYAEYADLAPIKMLTRQMELYAKRYARESEREAGQRQRLRQEEEKRDYEALKQKRREEQKKITRWEAQRKAELREQNSRIRALQAQKQEAMGGMQRYALDAEITRLEDVKAEIDACYDRMIRNERTLLEEMGKALEKAAGSSTRLVADARQQMLSGKTAAKMAENRQKQAATRKRQAVRRKIGALMHTISAGTDAKHIPEALRNTVAEFLQKIDPGFREDSKAAWKWREQTAVLAARMEEYNRAGGQMQVDAYIIAQLRTIGEDIAARIQTAGSSIREMKLTELQKLDETLDLLGAAIRNSDRILAEERSTRLAAVAQQSMEELRQRKAYQGRMKGMNELLNLQQLDAFSFAEKLGPAFQNSIFKNLRSGLDHKIQMLQEASAAMEQAAEQLPGKHMRDKLKALSGEQANTTIFPLENGTQIRLTTGQIMELYLLNQREAGRRHIYRGGITVEEYTAGRRKVKKQSRKQISEADIDAITETLTPAQKRFAEMLQHFCATTGSEWGNRVSLSLWGIKKFTDQRYWPIRVDNNTLETNTMPVDASSIARLKNIGISQSTNPGAGNALILGDVIDTYIRHMDDMTSYAAYVLPLEDAQRWLNYHGEDGATMKESVEKALGKGGVDYLEDFLETLNGGKRKGDSAPNWYNRLMRNYKIAAVAANLRVVIQQPSAYARAAAEIAPKYLLHAGKSRAQQESGMRMAQRYAPIFAWKQWGFRDTFVAGDLRSIMVGDRSFYEQIIQQSGALAGLADDMTWGALWNACAAEIRDTTTLEEGTEAFNRRVGERFSEVIDKTQVVDSPFHRSMGMRSGNNIWKTLTAFMSEPIKSYNMLYRAVADLRQSDWKDKAAWQRAVRSGTAFAAQNIINSLLAAVIDVFRDDDRDETLAEKYFGHTLENFLEGINPLETIPLAGDLLESLAPMLEGENPDFSNFQSDLGYEGLANLLTAAYDLYNSLGDYKKNDYYAIYKLISALGQVTGIPIGNAWRMVNSILQTAGVEITPYTKLATPYTAAEHAIKEIEAGRSGQATVDAYAEARGAEMLETQPEKYTDIQSAQNFAGNEVYRAMAILLSRENEAIPLTYAARERADTAEVDRIRAELTAKGYPAEVVDEAILIYASDMQEKKAYGEKEYQAQFYHTRHLEKAIDGGNLQDIRNIRAELIRDSTAQNPTATVDQAGLSYVKQQYLQAYESGASTQGLKRIATEIFGATEEQLQNWLLDDRSGDFYTALEAYDTTAANRSIAQLKELGREEKSITTSVTRKYREKLLQAYQSGEMGTVNRLMDLLHGLALYDFRTGEPYYSYEWMWGWLEAEA